MTQTQFYKLNSWAAEDRILRTDFNADNAKLDTALHTLDGKTAALEGKIAAERTYCNDKIAGERTHTDSGLSAVNNSITQTRTYAEGLVPIVKLMDTTLSADTDRWSVNLSGISWGSYVELTFSIELRMGTYSGGYVTVLLDNDNTTNYCPSDGSGTRYTYLVLMYPQNNVTGTIWMKVPYTPEGFLAQIAARNSDDAARFNGMGWGNTNKPTTMDFLYPNKIAAGSRVRVYGMKR